MKKFVSCWLPALCCLAALSMLSSSCVNEQAEEVLVQQTADMPAICATTCAEPATKVSVMPGEGDRTVAWDKGDALSVFYQNGHNLKYVLDGAGGSPTGLFEYSTGTPAARQFDEIVGVYPYSDGITYAGGYVNVTVPAEQAYAEGSFDPKANVMAGIADEEGNIAFQNLCGYLVLRLYGEEIKVKSVRLSGAMGEQLAGPVEMKVSEHSAPRITDWGSGASDEIVLKCAEPVAVGKTADEETEFWIVVPPMTFMDGISVSVETESGSCGASSDEYIQVFRSEICWMDPLCLASTEAAFTADIVWTYADDAEVDHNLFYVTGETPEAYSREALPLTVDESIVEKYGTELDGAVPDGVTVMCVDDEGGEVDVTGEVTVSGLAVADGVLTAGIEGFEWDKTYTVTMTFALSSTELTLTGTVTTTDRNREMITIPALGYVFEINKLDEETGFGYLEQDPVENSYYYWKSDDMKADIYAAFLEAGIITTDDFADADAFAEADLTGKVMMSDPAGTAGGYASVDKSDICLETLPTLTASVLAGDPFNSGERDGDDPNLWPGNVVTSNITTYIGEEVEIPFQLDFKVPDYNFLHLSYYTFNTTKENKPFIQHFDFADNDGSVLWWTQVYPSYFTEPADQNSSLAESQRRTSFRHALCDYDMSFINLAELAFNVVDGNDEIVDESKLDELGITVQFFYTDEELGDEDLPELDRIEPDFLTYGDLWIDNTVFYYRTNEKKFIPVYGTLTLKSGDYDFPVATRFEFPKAAVKYPEETLDYSTFAMVHWTPFKEAEASTEDVTIVLDENMLYRVPLTKGIELKDNRPQGVSYYVINDGEWVEGNVTSFDAEAGIYSTGGNGYVNGVRSKDAYRLTTGFEYSDLDIQAELRKLLDVKFSADGESFVDKQDEGGTLTPYLVYDYTSEVQFHGTVEIPVTITLESPWQEPMTFSYKIIITGVI